MDEIQHRDGIRRLFAFQRDEGRDVPIHEHDGLRYRILRVPRILHSWFHNQPNDDVHILHRHGPCVRHRHGLRDLRSHHNLHIRCDLRTLQRYRRILLLLLQPNRDLQFLYRILRSRHDLRVHRNRLRQQLRGHHNRPEQHLRVLHIGKIIEN